MPRSKRNKEIPLTQTRPKEGAKGELLSKARDLVDAYARVYALAYRVPEGYAEDYLFRSSVLRLLRERLPEARFLMGKLSVLQLALGRGPEDEYRDELHHLSARLRGRQTIGLLFTNAPHEDVQRFFHEFCVMQHPTTGFVSQERIVLDPAVLRRFPVSEINQLRTLGVPAVVDDGNIVLTRDFVLATPGVPITPEQAKMMEHADLKLAECRMQLLARWEQETSSFEALADANTAAAADRDQQQEEEEAVEEAAPTTASRPRRSSRRR